MHHSLTSFEAMAEKDKDNLMIRVLVVHIEMAGRQSSYPSICVAAELTKVMLGSKNKFNISCGF